MRLGAPWRGFKWCALVRLGRGSDGARLGAVVVRACVDRVVHEGRREEEGGVRTRGERDNGGGNQVGDIGPTDVLLEVVVSNSDTKLR